MIAQIKDDIELLNLMLEDHANAPAEYRATARWAEYSRRFVDFLKTESLKDFRRQNHPKGSPGAVLASFGAIDLNPKGVAPEDMYHAASTCFLKNKARKLDNLEASQVGNPEGFHVNEKFYTYSWLNFYCRYAYVSKFFDFDGKVLVELGSGSGKQAELLKKAHPNLTIVLFDLPTQLYVCHQYLSKVFEKGDEIVPYEESRNYQSFEDIKLSKINILPHWKFPILKNVHFDLFWNAASLQEMDPDTADNYLKLASSAKYFYLMYNIKYRKNASYQSIRGQIGSGAMANFKEVDRISAKLAYNTNWLYFDSFWRNRAFTQPHRHYSSLYELIFQKFIGFYKNVIYRR